MKLLIFKILVILLLASCTHTGTSPDGSTIELTDADIVEPEGFPYLGKWMLSPAKTPANWLGGLFRKRGLREPINVIIIDSISVLAEQAKAILIAACAAGGYRARLGHSDGYHAVIGGVVYEQLVNGGRRAFSDAPFEISNNHGRLFGPYFDGDKFIFVGAFSRESVQLLPKITHTFVSFNRARDAFAQNLDEKTAYKLVGFVDMGSFILQDKKIGTGDHDGLAVLLVRFGN